MWGYISHHCQEHFDKFTDNLEGQICKLPISVHSQMLRKMYAI